MRTVVHLSDLHFGSVRDAAVRPLVEQVMQISPDIIAISGDLTQRARKEQFQAARCFLDALPGTKIIVPGNHDVPLYNLVARFGGLARYRKHIVDDLEPFYQDSEIAVMGINTARSLTFKSGRINQQQVSRAKERLGGLASTLTKIIVTHHPFDLPEAYRKRTLVGRARMAIKQLNDCRVDLFLAGHFHVSGAAPTTFRLPVDGYSSLIVQAGTAISSRTRNEHNTFNVIRIDRPTLSIDRLEWNSERKHFDIAATAHYRHALHGWSPRSSP